MWHGTNVPQLWLFVPTSGAKCGPRLVLKVVCPGCWELPWCQGPEQHQLGQLLPAVGSQGALQHHPLSLWGVRSSSQVLCGDVFALCLGCKMRRWLKPSCVGTSWLCRCIPGHCSSVEKCPLLILLQNRTHLAKTGMHLLPVTVPLRAGEIFACLHRCPPRAGLALRCHLLPLCPVPARVPLSRWLWCVSPGLCLAAGLYPLF